MKLTILFLFYGALPLLAFSERTSGTQQDVQDAINGAPAGGVVEIPDGNYTWSGTLSINKSVHLRGASKGGVKISAPNAIQDVIALIEPMSGNLEISNLDFDYKKADNVWPYCVRLNQPEPRGSGRILIHDCKFKTNYAYAILWAANGGVCWNCTFENAAAGLGGISFAGGPNSEWSRPSTLGTLDTHGSSNIYVEDCVFQPTCGCNFDDNSRAVVRHCQINDSMLGSHGQETSPEGCRQWEVYDNQFRCDPNNAYNVNDFFDVRGGTGIVTDNNFAEIPWNKPYIALRVFSIRRLGQIPCQTQYPAARQVGQGWKGTGGYSYPSVPGDGSGYFTDPIYIWHNSGPGASASNFVVISEYNPDECGNGQQIANYVKLGRDYKLEAKAGYQKFAYPHPLRTAGGGAPTPTPPQPTPTATPPQPTPTPAATYEKWIQEQNDWIRANPPTPDR